MVDSGQTNPRDTRTQSHKGTLHLPCYTCSEIDGPELKLSCLVKYSFICQDVGDKTCRWRLWYYKAIRSFFVDDKGPLLLSVKSKSSMATYICF